MKSRFPHSASEPLDERSPELGGSEVPSAPASQPERDERLRVISDNIPGGATYQKLTQPDGTVRYTYISAGIEPLFGLNPESVMADPIPFDNLVVADDRERLAAAEAEALREGKALDGEFRWRTVAGDTKWVHCRSTARRRRDGSVLWNGVILDITARKEAEEKLRRSEALYRAIGESIDYGVWVCDPDGRNTYASESFLKLVGITQEQCSNFGWGDVLHPDDAQRTIEAWQQCCRTGGLWDIEHRFRGVDGHYHDVLARGVPVRNERGELICWAGINLDISRLKRAQAATRASEARFRLLSETAGRLLASADTRRLISHLCHEVMAHLDCQVFFNYLAEVGPGVGDPSGRGSSGLRLHLNTYAGISDTEARQIEWLEPGVGMAGCVARDRQCVVAEDVQHSQNPRDAIVKRYGVQAHGCHPLVAHGHLLGTLSFGTTTRPRFTAEEVELMRTIADQVAVAMQRMQTLAALEAARAEAVSEHARLAAVMETLPVGVAILDAQRGIVHANPRYEQVWGAPRPAVGGVLDYADFEAWFADGGRPVQADEWASARAIRCGETVVGQELEIQRFDGSRAYVLNSAAPIRDGEGRITGCVVAIQDITEHKRAEALQRQLEFRMQQAQKYESLGVLAGGIAHDFNNLLTIVLGSVGLVSSGLPAGTPGRRHLERAVDATRRAADLCQQMLAYAGQPPLSFAPVELNRLLEDMAPLIGASLSKQAQLEWDLEDPLPPVQGDPSRLRQLFMNLLVNASEAIGGRPGRITLVTRSARCTAADLQSPWVTEPLLPGEYVLVEVTDTGCGIEAGTLSRIFDPFFSTKFTGRGLGLAAVLGIVRSHQGTIQVRSKVGGGSTFRVGLPVAASTSAVPSPGQRPGDEWGGAGMVLVVDDEADLRSTTRTMIEQLGFETLTASHGKEALELFRADPERIGCVLLDVTMPELDGEATFQELVRIRPEVRVILSSGYAKDDVLARFAGRSVSGFLQKPYDLQTLAAVLHGLWKPPA